jgi:hypothetical protein
VELGSVMKRCKTVWLGLFSLLSFYVLPSVSLHAQRNFLGKPGLIRIPTASIGETRDYAFFQVSRMPIEYRINNFMNKPAEEMFYSAQVQPLSWVGVNFVLTRPVDISRIGIGDRHLDLQFFLLNEKKHGLNLSLIVSPMFGSSFIDHNSLILSKTLSLTKEVKFQGTIGYGLESVYKKPLKRFKFEDKGLQWIPKSLFGNYYLSGFFLGGQVSIKDNVFFSAEYDSQYVNFSGSVLLFDKLGLQVSFLDVVHPTASLSYTIFLDKPGKVNYRTDDK